jgi:DUF917 family protein
MNLLNSDITPLGIGSNFLGSGGGVESLYTRALLQQQIERKALDCVSLSSLKTDDLILPIIVMGCPTVESEQNYNVTHFEELIKKIETCYQRPISALAIVGVGGGLPFFPLFLSSFLNIPILDADLAGRCFPELQMISINLAGIPAKKAFMVNAVGHMFEIDCDNFEDLESYARQITVGSGGLCTIILQVLTGEEAKKSLIPGTLTQTLEIGKIIQEKKDFNALEDYTHGKLVGIGGVVSINSLDLPPPFTTRITVRNFLLEKEWEIFMANEYDLLLENGVCINEVPDIITLCHPHTCLPIMFNHLCCNINVAIFTMKAPDIWYTQKGLALVRSENYLQGKEKILCALE